MHPRNPYKTPPDFQVLANAYPALKLHLIHVRNGTASIDFNDNASQRCLTEALLFRDFGLKVSLSAHRLCPPIPNRSGRINEVYHLIWTVTRLNYVLWIQDLMLASDVGSEEQVHGIDIGTGASAVYPLLACSLEPLWRFTATDVDELSLAHARENIRLNALEDKIRIVSSTLDGPILLPLALDPNSNFHFTMCNPPFYASSEEIVESAQAKEFEPQAVCTGAQVEMITSGGESAFVRNMIMESLQHRGRCWWYTSMLGKMSSLTTVVALLREHAIENYAITEFVQGQTRRWAIAWSFLDLRLPDSVARIHNPSLYKLMPAHNTITQQYSSVAPLEDLTNILDSNLATIASVSHEKSSPNSFIIHATHDTWSRSARRKRNPAMETTISATKCSAVIIAAEQPGSYTLQLHWNKGIDRALFESLCSHISRKFGEALNVLQ